jgi:hypothetical protein
MEKGAFELRGEIAWLGVANGLDSLVTTEMRELKAYHYGISGDKHGGQQRQLDAREVELRAWGLPKGIEIANRRQFSAVSAEELWLIAAELKCPNIPYGSLGENLVIRGIPHFSGLPRGTKLFFESPREKRSAVLEICAPNGPCQYPGQVLQRHFPDIPRLEQLFPTVAQGKRGVVGIVYASGTIKFGDAVVAKIPPQRLYDPPGHHVTVP